MFDNASCYHLSIVIFTVIITGISSMHTKTIERLEPSHDFVHVSKKNQTRVWIVLAITAVTMVAEIIAGLWFGSMALLADGWHMSTHLVAFGITLFAWNFALSKKDDPSFSFSTGKVSVLAGFASAIFLVIVAVLMALESISRFFNPHEIAFDQAILVATIGLIVNVVSAFLLHADDDGEEGHHHGHSHASHSHSHSHSHGHSHGGKDHNHHAAYLHVLADALTSVAAIVALLAGKFFGLNWLDPVMGIVGGVLILIWAKGLIISTAEVLLDKSLDEETCKKIVDRLEDDHGDRVIDFHVWKVSANHYAAIISIVCDKPDTPEAYKAKLKQFKQLEHITIEVNPCDDESCELHQA